MTSRMCRGQTGGKKVACPLLLLPVVIMFAMTATGTCLGEESAIDTKAASSSRSRLNLVEKAKLSLLQEVPARNEFLTVAFSPDAKYVAIGDSMRNIRIWDWKRRTIVHVLEGRQVGRQSIAFSSDGHHLISCEYDGSCTVWSVRSGKRAEKIQVKSQYSPNAIFVDSDTKIMTGNDRGQIDIWNISNSTLLRRLSKHKRGPLTFARATHPRVWSGGRDGLFILWDIQTGQAIKTIELTSDSGLRKLPMITSIAFAPAQNLALVGRWGGQVELWDLKRGKYLRTFKFYPCIVWSVAFSPDGKRAAIGTGWLPSQNGTHTKEQCAIVIWDVTTGKLLAKTPHFQAPVMGIAFARYGKAFASISDGTARVWELSKEDATGRQQTEVPEKRIKWEIRR